MSANQETELLRFITCGSVDDGKSTLIGRLLFDVGQVFDDQMTALDDASNKYGTQGQERDYALLVDGLEAEREQGITIDVAYRYFRTPKRAFIAADVPGHEQYTRNMATGASTAQIAIILIDARKGVLAQTRRHASITSMVGVKNVVLAINKMDLVGYSKATYDTIVTDFTRHAKELGFSEIAAIPICAILGENVTTKSANMVWYDGPHLLEYLENVAPFPISHSEFRFPVQWVNRPNLDFRGFSGTVSSGTIKLGQQIIVSSSLQTSRVARICTYDGDLSEASQGQAITIVLEDEIDVSRGDVLSLASSQLRSRKTSDAKILWFSSAAMRLEKDYVIKHATSQTNAKITNIKSALDFATLQEVMADGLAMNGIGSASISLSRPLLVEPYEINRDLGSFILIDKISNETVAMGLFQGQTKPTSNGRKTQFENLAKLAFPNIENPNQTAQKALYGLAISSIATFSMALLVTNSFAISALLAFLDFAFKPVIWFLFLRDAREKAEAALANIDGSGI
ncbi:MAG: sulfate adenylyltransferase subunit 1 [Hyphomonadaceae bacterium]|nr:MAG: sulfate adenylyltransferase subunit 1 [Hyphomonadaceae bacterium]KAF0183468.1 MAG: sulfate adenylyltransferase subunit 1 [Hyphomonadaceae bacterium]